MSNLVEHFFRHEYGRLVAMLSCRIGVEFIEDIEDAVQSALLVALERWTIHGIPKHPSGWLFRVAQNTLVGELRTQNRRLRILQNKTDLLAKDESSSFADEDIRDDFVRMLFVCCHESLPIESQLAFSLKTLCGFSIREIAIRLFTSDANIYKRISRARTRLCAAKPSLDRLLDEEFLSRLPGVHRVLYLMFTEGYLSSDPDISIQSELADEAIRLAEIVAAHPTGPLPTTCALLALMHLHTARTKSRQDASGGLLLLEEQDRGMWDRQKIQHGIDWLAKSADGDTFSRFHAEAGIAAEHCLARSYAETRWDRVAENYAILEELYSSPIHRLNRAIAVAEWKGPSAGLAVLDGFSPPSWLAGSYQWSAVLADLHRRCGNQERAARYFESACVSAPNDATRKLLRRRLEQSNMKTS